MRTRKALRVALGVGLLSVCIATPAQRSEKVYRIGFLGVRSRSTPATPDIYYDAWLSAMRDLGYVEGKNLVVEWRFAENKVERLQALAAELAGMKLDVISTHALLPTMALQKATHSIPIVFASIPDPVGNRVVASLAHPGGNITGSSLMSADLSAKRVELLKQLRPSLTSVAVLTNPDNPVHSSIVKITQNAARSLAIRVSPIEARSAGEIERGLSTLSREKATGLMVLDDAVFNGYASLIARLALSCQVPSMYANPDLVEFGGLAGYGASGFDAYRRAAALVDKILRGANPRELPVEQPTKFYLVLNKKTAGSLAVSFPPELVLLADRVIE